jgi:ABC-type nitrate/sulfonate/bicarbonate transport system ATPase subunit
MPAEGAACVSIGLRSRGSEPRPPGPSASGSTPPDGRQSGPPADDADRASVWQRAAPADAVSVSAVSRTYTDRARRGGASGAVQALADVSLHAARGELLAVVGPSGCGKTTLLELICGLQAPDVGSVRCEPAALMPQRDLLLPWLSAVDNAALALRIARRPRAQARARAAALFAELGLAGFEEAHPQELSGGMRQRVAFLRTLLSDKPVLCLDEPFGALDAITRAEMQDWLVRALRREPRTVVLVTHDVEEAVLLADRVVVMGARPGRVVAELDVALPRPRVRTDTQIVALRERALLALGLEGPRPQEPVLGAQARVS